MSYLLHVVLYQPEIPPNTGNIIRLCANTGAKLHLIEPLGFTLEDRDLRRAGLDYHEWAEVKTYKTFNVFLDEARPTQVFAFSTRGRRRHTDMVYGNNDALLFGPETRGLPQEILEKLPETHRARLPMREGSRSLNLSNTVAVVVYEAWRQLDFVNGI
jgi:tRNA (cytidine/uridine-2'-O-)-methyltransferase